MAEFATLAQMTLALTGLKVMTVLKVKQIGFHYKIKVVGIICTTLVFQNGRVLMVQIDLEFQKERFQTQSNLDG